MKLAYYPGCSIHASSREYEISARAILRDFDIELEEIKDWNCCGAIEASSVDHLLSVALPSRNLTLADTDKIIMLCSACQQIHNKVKEELAEDEVLRGKVEEIIGEKIDTDIEVKHLLYFITREIEEEKIKLNVKRKLVGLRVIPYYGCCVDRPSRYIGGDNPDFPESLEKIITALGGSPIPFSYKTKCCGGTLLLPNEDISFSMTRNILLEAKKAGAGCIAVVCPLCHFGLEKFSMKLGLDIPVLYFTQLMGIAFGYKADELGLNRNLISAEKLIKRYE